MGHIENDLTRAALEYLEMRGCFCWRNNSGSYKPEGTERYIRFGFRGSSDILGLSGSGRFLSIEAKTETGRLSAYQRAFMEAVVERGGIAVCIRPSDWKEVLDAMLATLR